MRYWNRQGDLLVTIKLESIIPLGRRREEYMGMFNLNDEVLDLRILDCGGGPSSFNFELTKSGGSITSIDPIYQFSHQQIQDRINATFDDIMNQAESNKDQFIWSQISSVDDLRDRRKTAMEMFIKDFSKGKQEGRYIYAQLPELPFEGGQFDLALCSHLLFLYSDSLTYDFHVEAIKEMLRVSAEIRIFPIVDLTGQESKYMDDIIKEFRNKGYQVKLEYTEYEFFKNANMILCIEKQV